MRTICITVLYCICVAMIRDIEKVKSQLYEMSQCFRNTIGFPLESKLHAINVYRV